AAAFRTRGARHGREFHDPEREADRLAALVRRIEGAAGVPAAIEEGERARLGVEIDVRLAELERGEGRRQQAGVDQAAYPFERVDDARVTPLQLAGEQLAVIVEPEL